MILLNLTDEILESARKEGREVVEVEMTLAQVVAEVAEEADLIQQVVDVVDDFGYEMPGQRQRKDWLNIFDSFQAQRRDKSHTTP